VTCLWVVVCCVAVATAQTFQYSRGWTNGRKRAALSQHQQLHVRRAAEVAVKRAAAILEDAGLLLVPAACDSQPLTFHLLRRPPTMQVYCANCSISV
jgi:Pro-corazonin